MIKKPFSTLIHSALLTAAFSLTVVACGGGGGTKTDTTPIVVTPADKVAPIITLAGDATVSHTQGTAYSDPGATAQDAVDGLLEEGAFAEKADQLLGRFDKRFVGMRFVTAHRRHLFCCGSRKGLIISSACGTTALSKRTRQPRRGCMDANEEKNV